MPEHDDSTDPDEGPSKSELKRRMSALQAMGESLTALSDKQLEQLPLADERLALAIRETRSINSNSARKRHMQFIGKLMRDLDPAPIKRALRDMQQQRQQGTAAFHQLEQLRQDVLAAGLPGVELVMVHWPQADRQQLRQLLLQHQREQKLGKPPVASRKLFKYLRMLQDSQLGDD